MTKKTVIGLIITSVLLGFLTSQCSSGTDDVVTNTENAAELLAGASSKMDKWKKTISEYNFFKGDAVEQVPQDDVIPYDLNTPLFSDYAHKLRFVKLPEGTSAKYDAKEAMDFPVGTVIIKTFYYPHDFRDERKGRRLMETRLLVNDAEEGWVGLPYIWNEEQTEATLEIAGGRSDVSWIHHDGEKRELNYVVPNKNQCKGCHVKGTTMKPIGPSARQLNGNFAYTDGEHNQLLHWQELGIIEGLPEMANLPRVPNWWDKNDGTLDERARAYLDINCSHCHDEDGPANTSGLMLDVHEENPFALGVMKAPVAAGRGSGGLSYSIVPGAADESILWYRMASTDPGVMMPELARKLVHDDGVELIRQWINAMDSEDYQ